MDQHTDGLIAKIKSEFALVHSRRDLALFVDAHQLVREPSPTGEAMEKYVGLFHGMRVRVTATATPMDPWFAFGARCHVIVLQVQAPGENYPRQEVALRFDEP